MLRLFKITFTGLDYGTGAAIIVASDEGSARMILHHKHQSTHRGADYDGPLEILTVKEIDLEQMVNQQLLLVDFKKYE